MGQIAAWSAALVAGVYGALTAWAGFWQLKAKKVPAWSAWGFVILGALTLAGGAMVLLKSGNALWVLAIGLAGIHLLAIDNGRRMFGRLRRSHHLVRLAVSAALLGLAYLGLR